MKIATRKSKLAQVQTEIVMKLISDICGISSEKLLVTTEGDRMLDVTLDKIGGKGLFVKEIEAALLKGEAECAVHSMKDVPHILPKGFTLVAIPEREDVRDVFVSSNGTSFFNLKKGAVIGTSSIRRANQLRELRSDLKIVPIRGNLQTRLEKMKKENMDGIILAAAGLKRLGLQDIITDFFDPSVFVPAIGQGALGVEALENSNFLKELKKLDNEEARLTVEAERAFMRELNGDCHSYIGAYANINGEKLNIIGTYMINGKIVRKEHSGKKDNAIEVGKELAKLILLEGK